jgi:hypothetical protein
MFYLLFVRVYSHDPNHVQFTETFSATWVSSGREKRDEELRYLNYGVIYGFITI